MKRPPPSPDPYPRGVTGVLSIVATYGLIIAASTGSDVWIGLALSGVALGIAFMFLKAWGVPDPAVLSRMTRALTRQVSHQVSDGLAPYKCLISDASWGVMRIAARLMAPPVGRRWLAEAESFLFEATPAAQAEATRNYLLTAPQVIAVSWTTAAAQRLRLKGPAIRRSDAEDNT